MRAFATLLAVFALAAGCSRTPLGQPDDLNRCLLIDPDGPSATQVSGRLDLARSDILLLLDNSASMAAEIGRIRDQLVDVLVPRIKDRVSDPRLAVATFSDFGSVAVGQRSHPYWLRQDMTDNIDSVARALRSVEIEPSGDGEESQLEALFQAATGAGLGAYVEPHSCPSGTHGGVCFREGAFAIVLLFTDAPMRNVDGLLDDGTILVDPPFDPRGTDVPFIPVVREYDETLEALTKEQMRVIGLWSGTQNGREDIRRVANDTGALDEQGDPIVFDIGQDGSALDDAVVDSLESLSAGVRLDVGLAMYDGNLLDAVDPRGLVTEVRAVKAAPATGAEIEPSGGFFVDVVAGTEVTFELTIDPRLLPDDLRGQRYPLGVVIEAEDGTLLSEEVIDLFVPAAPDELCVARP